MGAAEAEAKKRNWKMNIAVVDPNGDLINFRPWRCPQEPFSAKSQGKARTAARYRRPTQVFYNAYETGHPYIPTLDRTLVASPAASRWSKAASSSAQSGAAEVPVIRMR